MFTDAFPLFSQNGLEHSYGLFAKHGRLNLIHFWLSDVKQRLHGFLMTL